jgi:S-adenosylmethionine:tRNA ribosyltransferase-isomerase
VGAGAVVEGRRALSLDTSDFDYDLPQAAIARSGVEPRDRARLLVDAGDRVEHRHVADLPEFLAPGDVVVVNDTKVLPARVRFRRPTGGSAELLLLEPAVDGWWEALVRPSAKFAVGVVVEIAEDLSFEVGADLGEGRRRVRPVTDDLDSSLARHGEMPLPPYLGDVHLDDPDRYQTIYAARAASAAAPTAGLHLTTEVLDGIAAAGATIARVELVVGLGTFRPIAAETVEDHVMHREHYRVTPEAWSAVEAADRVVAIGTTTVRALESAASLGELSGTTDLFLRRGSSFVVVDAMLTNFHLPRSSLLVMIDAFIGPRWRELYTIALAAGYRFLSFGDAMFLQRTPVGATR